MSERREARKDQIFSEGARLFAQKGYERTSLQEVADALGLTKPALYYYYSSKEQLLYEIMSFVMDRVLADIGEVAATDAAPVEKMREMIRKYLGFFAAHPHELTLMSTAGDSLGPELRGRIVVRERQYLELVKGIVAEVLGERRREHLDQTAVAFALIGGMSWIFKWYDPEGRIDPGELAEVFAKIYSHGLLGPAA
ncbi:MAG: TetR/AcrR family transcriptional regulator [Deltaproteobacteria bacterium]|nr:TetR/AcrR family transcriptional regulator [Deltaproteobacteria bacterium]